MDKLVCIVCDMIVNDKNFDFNKNGLLNKNNEENISTCPFCGAGIKYLKPEKDELGLYSLDDELKTILDHAMKLEVFNSEFYLEAASLAVDEKVKEMFKALSNIEKMHANVHKKLGGFSKLPELQQIDYSKYKTDKELLEQAKLREEHAIHFYNKYIPKINEPIIRDILKELTRIEKEHIILTAV